MIETGYIQVMSAVALAVLAAMVQQDFHIAGVVAFFMLISLVLEMRTAWEEFGHTLSRGGWPVVIVSAGYVGSALVGAALIAAGEPVGVLVVFCRGDPALDSIRRRTIATVGAASARSTPRGSRSKLSGSTSISPPRRSPR